MITLDLYDKHKNENPKHVLKYEPAHYSRYTITANLIKQITKGQKEPAVLDVGGKKGLLRELGINSTIIDIEESNEKNYVQGDALHMPFEESSFDVVVTCDVLEHIQAKDREQFISELVRVSKGFVIIGAPFNQPGVAQSEIAANSFYRSLSKSDHHWLKEHIDNDLPDIERTAKFLKKQKLNFSIFRHLSLPLWDITTKIHFLVAVFGDQKAITKMAHDVYSAYHDHVSDVDFSENGYRTFIVINKKEKFSIKTPEESQRLQAIESFTTMSSEYLIDGLQATLSKLKDTNNAYAKLANNYNRTAARVHQLDQELAKVKSHRVLRLAKKFTK